MKVTRADNVYRECLICLVEENDVNNFRRDVLIRLGQFLFFPHVAETKLASILKGTYNLIFTVGIVFKETGAASVGN